jgi:diacylglycerol kinase family enzyme
VHSLRATSLEILNCVHLQIDGEYAGKAVAKLDIVPEALTLLLPSVYS